MTEQVLALAREWAIDRHPLDKAERALFLAIVDAFPQDFQGKEACSCGCPEKCEDCLGSSALFAYIENMRTVQDGGRDVH